MMVRVFEPINPKTIQMMYLTSPQILALPQPIEQPMQCALCAAKNSDVPTKLFRAFSKRHSTFCYAMVLLLPTKRLYSLKAKNFLYGTLCEKERLNRSIQRS
jgi:hypothetical protein